MTPFPHHDGFPGPRMSRRELLRRASNGFGTLALGALLARTSGSTTLAAAAASGATPAGPGAPPTIVPGPAA
jgi:hypothetical protein